MPIAQSELDKPANAHLLQPAADSVYKALTAWRHTAGSQEWWWLVIDHGGQHYTALRFTVLRDLLTRFPLEVEMRTRLADLPARRENPSDFANPLPGVITPRVVEMDAISTARAWQMTQDAPGRLLVVVENGEFRGILSRGERTFAFADKPLLDMLTEFEHDTGSETLIISDPKTPPPDPPEMPPPAPPSTLP